MLFQDINVGVDNDINAFPAGKYTLIFGKIEPVLGLDGNLEKLNHELLVAIANGEVRLELRGNKYVAPHGTEGLVLREEYVLTDKMLWKLKAFFSRFGCIQDGKLKAAAVENAIGTVFQCEIDYAGNARKFRNIKYNTIVVLEKLPAEAVAQIYELIGNSSDLPF